MPPSNSLPKYLRLRGVKNEPNFDRHKDTLYPLSEADELAQSSNKGQMSEPMSKAGIEPNPLPPHLIAGLVAVIVVSICLASVSAVLGKYAPDALSPIISQPSSAKDLGLLLQGLALAEPAVLPVYGSSELTREESNRADRFFANAPTGFRVCPVGGPGNTCLLMAEKLAAQAEQLNRRKVVVFLSCSWFRRPTVPDDHYAGNFSPAQATEIVLNANMDPDLRRRFTRRLLDYRGAMKDLGPLRAYTNSIVTPHLVSRWSGATQRPLLETQRVAMRIEDRLSTLFAIWMTPANKDSINVAVTEPFSWETIIEQAAEFAPPPGPPKTQDSQPRKNADARFIGTFDDAKEWADLELMLDTLKAFHAEPLIVAIPLDGKFEDSIGVTLKGRNYYYNRIKELCAPRGFRFEHFTDHDQDSDFLISHSSHPTGKGWIFMNRLLDDFYHDRLPAPDSHS